MTNINEKFEDFIFLNALENAINFSGKANPKALFGKTISKFPEIKKDIDHYKNKIENIVKEVNSMSPLAQKDRLKKLNPKFFEKNEKKSDNKKEKYELPELIGATSKIRVRTEPAPSGYLHLGHIFNIIFNYEYKKKYGGEFIVRFGDTNPDNINIKNYDRILEDVKWLTDNGVDEIYYQSDRLNIYYKYLRQLMETGNSYVCTCENEVFKKYNESCEPCPHRNIDIQTQMKEYDKMFNGTYKSGDCVIRFKADLKNKNPALRDFPIARINTNSHARVKNKYNVWPMMNLTVAIDDADMKLTHVIRGKDHEINMNRQNMIHKVLGMKIPNYFHLGRMKFEDLILSKTQLTEKIESGEFSGWDDPRVPSILSYRKRGYKAQAFRNMVLAGGISKRDSRITEIEFHKALNFFNKQILEKEANRYSFVVDPKEIKIKGIEKYPSKEILLPKHPELKNKGTRKIEIKNEYFIDGIDFKNIQEKEIIRLMHFANFKVLKKNIDNLELEYLSKDYDKEIKIKRNIQFVPRSHDDHKHIEIIMQNGQPLKGITEEISNPKEGDVIQFERFGFVRFDHINNNKKQIYYFTHR